HTGSVKGLCARGGFEVDIAWKDNQLTSATVRSAAGATCRLRYGQATHDLTIKKGETATWNGR
ncbi:MAG: glycoside hydrolase family 95-like protein, partial [Planctomycetota bacterium]